MSMSISKRGVPLSADSTRWVFIEDKGAALGAALKAVYLAGESPAPGIAYLPG